MKKWLVRLGIAYLVAGVIYNTAVVMPKKYGWRTLTISPYETAEPYGGLAEVLFWPWYAAGVLPRK